MFSKKIILDAHFPEGFEPSDIRIPPGVSTGLERLISSRTAWVVKFHILVQGQAYGVVLKVYLVRNVSDFFKSLFLPSRAQRAFKGGQMLLENGFLAPKAVAYGRNFLMTMEVADSVMLHKALPAAPAEQQRKMIEQFATIVGRLHDKGISHGDLRLGNVLVKEEHGDFAFYLLDNERTTKYRSLPWKLRVKNLVQTTMSRDAMGPDGLDLFFRTYLAQQSRPVEAQRLMAEVNAKATQRLERARRRRGAPDAG